MKITHYIITIIAVAFLFSSCDKLEPAPLEDRLPMFEWYLNQNNTVSGFHDTITLTDVIKGLPGYPYIYNYSNFKLKFTDETVDMYENNYNEEEILIETGLWNYDGSILNFSKTFNLALNEYIMVPDTIRSFETVSFRGQLFIGSVLFHEQSQTNVCCFMSFTARDPENDN